MSQTENTPVVKLLIVDDEPNNIDSLLRIFRLSGYRMSTATNGKDALKLLTENEFDLILMDVMMPVLNGYQTCELIKKNPDYAHIPVVFLTAFHDPENVLKGLELGAIDYINKPFMPREVLVRVRNYVALKKAQDQLTVYNHQLEKILQERTKTLIQIERQAAVSLSIQGILHNLKNPLTGIVGGVEIVSEVIDTHKQSIQEQPELKAELCDAMIEKIINTKSLIERASNKLMDMINSILVRGRKDRQAEYEVFDLSGLINQEKDYFEADNLYQLDVKYVVRLDQEELYCRSIPVEIAQVLHNLVKNAIDAMYERVEEPQITIKTGGKQDEIWFEVGDNGPGVPEDIRTHLFEPFYSSKRMENSGNGQVKGSGLGLYSCWELVNSNHGEILLAETSENGTVFRVTLPRVTLV